MAQIFPPIETVKKLRQKPTEGELHILHLLKDALDDSFEVYFQPFLNGDMPDIVIMRKGSGVYVIEVKDWNLDAYQIQPDLRWNLKSNNSVKLISPIDQVNSYKDQLFKLHIPGLFEAKLRNRSLYAIVNCGVYFHKHNTANSKRYVLSIEGALSGKQKQWYQTQLRYTDILGNDLDCELIAKTMANRRMDKPSYFFTDDLYDRFKRQLNPPLHTIEQGIPINYSKEQAKVIESRSGLRQKVKGVAGSGKTMCLAKRAVNAHLRTKERVLILTFNITLRNYIRDKINEVRENFSWKNFHIIHYHEFFASQARNANLKMHTWDDFDNPEFFAKVRGQLPKYSVVIFDEIQDFKKVWQDVVKKNFWDSEGGELVVFGDEKQNIYRRTMEVGERKPYTGIPGAWNLLKKSFRVSNEIARLAEKFQRHFFNNRYELDSIETQQNLFDQSVIIYKRFESFEDSKILQYINRLSETWEVHENDICIQAVDVHPLREIEAELRQTSPRKTNTMFETPEEFGLILEQNKCTKEEFLDGLRKSRVLPPSNLNEEEEKKWNNEVLTFKSINEILDELRRSKKFNFWANPGLIKLTTVHSFKGWEVHTLFLLIGMEDEQSEVGSFTSDELIYTAITRCRCNLCVINVNNEKYHEFFLHAVDS